ncbi:MAG TPA: DNA-formamidopyrimidine glycosylase family protein [Myxococcota bacterium]|nr:DNA-formamidopyrimidine glycosylase family protein [Myxococcota bacterium]
MPELPDLTVYCEALRARLRGATLERARVLGVAFLRSVDPPLSVVEGGLVVDVHRLGKRVVLEFEQELFLVIHLMIAGRFRWKPRGAKPLGKIGLATFDFSSGTLQITEASTKKRATLHVARGRESLRAHDPGGLEVLNCGLEDFRRALLKENRTLKRVLTDPHAFSGIGNAYSDEILHCARLSPVKLTGRLNDAEISRLFEATRITLSEWTDRLRREAAGRFPEKVTAFRPGMAVHGRYREACPECGSPVQRIVHAENETNYCARCQTGGRLLADRALSRLLKADWPRTLEEWEDRHWTGRR